VLDIESRRKGVWVPTFVGMVKQKGNGIGRWNQLSLLSIPCLTRNPGREGRLVSDFRRNDKEGEGIQRSMNEYFVYILANKRNGTLYVGFTSNLAQRVYAHKNDLVEGFTRKYKIHMLVHFERGSYEGALQREKQIKEWKRQWKIELIEKANPEWRDLYEDIL
jgi:putative endonuclease